MIQEGSLNMKSLNAVFEEEVMIVSDDLIIENLKEEDTAVIAQLFEKDVNPLVSELFVQLFLTRQKNHEFLLLMIRDRNRSILGTLELYDFHERDFELGYRICSAYEGKGICTKAVRLLLEYMKQYDITHVTAHVDTDNTPSRHILSANGFEETGRNQNTIRMEMRL